MSVDVRVAWHSEARAFAELDASVRSLFTMFKLPRAGPISFLTWATLRRLKRECCGCLGNSELDSQQVPLVPHQTSSHSSDEVLVSVSRVGLGEAQS
eukprot:7994854-Pyramimonas_sp.AAC.1